MHGTSMIGRAKRKRKRKEKRYRKTKRAIVK
jgi:hypothetical protein